MAKTSERADNLGITREASSFVPDGVLRTDPRRPALVSVTKALPAPFFGKAELTDYARRPPSWTGTLAVRLPGGGAMPLSGESFSAVYCPPADPKRFSSCLSGLGGGLARLERLASQWMGRAEAGAQGSGSQSQFLWDARLSWSR